MLPCQNKKLPDFIVIIVCGAFSSGKSEIIYALSQTDVKSAEKTFDNGQSILVDFGLFRIPHTPITLYFFSEPSIRRGIEQVAEVAVDQRIGIIFVIDGAKEYWQDEPSDVSAQKIYAEEIIRLQYLSALNVPCIIFANKQDKADARSPDELRAILGVPSEIPVLPTSATTDPASVRYAVLELLIRLP